jgi:hypothetical protein
MWTVERACMMGMQKSDIYSERNRHCVSGCRVACSMFHAATRVLCVSNSRQLAYPGLSYRPIRYLHPMRYNRGRDGAPARGRRAKMRPARTPRDKKSCPNSDHPPGSGATHSTWTSTSASPRSAFSQHAPSRLGQSGHAAPRLTQLESPSHPAASAGPLTGPLHPFHVTRPNAGMCRVSRITCVGTVAAFQDSGTCDA